MSTHQPTRKNLSGVRLNCAASAAATVVSGLLIVDSFFQMHSSPP